jgi:hypothetical protein
METMIGRNDPLSSTPDGKMLVKKQKDRKIIIRQYIQIHKTRDNILTIQKTRQYIRTTETRYESEITRLLHVIGNDRNTNPISKFL